MIKEPNESNYSSEESPRLPDLQAGADVYIPDEEKCNFRYAGEGTQTAEIKTKNLRCANVQESLLIRRHMHHSCFCGNAATPTISLTLKFSKT